MRMIGLAVRPVAGVFVWFEWRVGSQLGEQVLPGNAVLLGGPGAEVNQLAAF